MRNFIRGAAMGLGVLIMVNLVGALTGGFDANGWWIDFYRLPLWSRAMLMAISAVLLVGWAVRPMLGRWRGRVSVGWLIMLAMVCAINAMVVTQMQSDGRIVSSAGLPMSAGMCVMLIRKPATAKGLWIMAGGWVLFFVMFALGQMWCYGRTDYRRPADAIVVFGAKVYADGRLSAPLADRVRTGVELYQQGYAPLVIMSGGPGSGGMHETTAMRDYAVSLGVPADRIVLDPAGLSTRDTVRQTMRMFDELHVHRVLAVSHAYHLPRVKLAYQQAQAQSDAAQAITVFTVPAKERYVLRKMPYYVAREVAAWWSYYLGGLFN